MMGVLVSIPCLGTEQWVGATTDNLWDFAPRHDFDENLSGTRLRHVRDAQSDPVFRHKGGSLLGGSH